MDGRGLFIVLEGGEGAGKSSVQRALAARLQGDGRDVVLTREPGGTPLGEKIRALLLESALDDAVAELLLFEAARAHLVSKVIRPALERGATVICDRYAASSVAYQGWGRELGREIVEVANDVAMQAVTPDLTLLLDVPPADGLARRAGQGARNRFDRETVAFHERVRQGFLALAAESPATWVVVDASQPLAGVVERCVQEVLAVRT
jgi:dTMP kinase